MMILDLVDSVEYASTNCYVHQLTKCLNKIDNVKTVALADCQKYKPDAIVCRLKQRTIFRVINELRPWIGTNPIVYFDQDPWHSYMDDSPYKGTYDKLRNLNLKGIALTTEWWANRLKTEFNLPGVFVKMGMLPEYCDIGNAFEHRKIQVSFIGSVHPRRKKLFDELSSLGINVDVRGNTLGYHQYLMSLQNIGIFVHSEDAPIVVNGEPDNMGKGMWIKDVEAAARGCFSIRNNEVGAESYCEGIQTIKLYNNVNEIPEIIKNIVEMDSLARFCAIFDAVHTIKDQNNWMKTARTLVELVSN